jgi:hypothetical protein
VKALPLILTLGAALAVSTPMLFACGGPAAPAPSATMQPTSATASPSPSLPDAASGSVVDVKAVGAVGDGSTDDSVAVQRAVDRAASSGDTVYFPAGTYDCSSAIKLPDDVRLRGQGEASWLKGVLRFASSDTVEQLKIGDVGDCAVTNEPDAVGTTFSDCRLHGGGSRQGVESSVVYLGGPQGNVSRVRFVRCQIERTSYVPPAGVDAFAANVGNTITIHEFTYLHDSGHVEDITFRDCHLGASNGHASGALRMMMEAYSWAGDSRRVYHGWKDLTFDGCTIEASDTTGLDFADTTLTSDPTRHSASGVLVTGCTFLGAHKNLASRYSGLPIVYECPTGIVIRHNTFYASPREAIGGSNVGQGVTDAPALLITGNTFDMTRSPIGQQHERGEPCISLVGYNSRVLDNNFIYDIGEGVLIQGAGGATTTVGNLVKGNLFTDRRTSGGEPTIHLADERGAGCHDNRIVGNTIHNHAAGRTGVIAQTSGSGTNYAVKNSIDCGGALPFVVLSGKIVQAGNRIKTQP